jgi:hypothetical protein
MPGEKLHTFDVQLCRHALECVASHRRDPKFAAFIKEGMEPEVDEALRRERALHEPRADRPVPRGPQGGDFLLERDRGERLAAVLLLGPVGDVPLEVCEGKLLERELRAEGPLEVGQVHADGAERVVLHRPDALGVEILALQVGERDGLGRGSRLLDGCDLPAREDEIRDGDAGRDAEQFLLEAAQELADGAGEVLGLVLVHLADGHRVAAAQVVKLAVVRAALEQERRHEAPPT